MKLICFHIVLFISFAFITIDSLADDRFKLQSSLIYLTSKNQIAQDVFYKADSNSTARLSIYCYRINNADSVLIYFNKSAPIKFKKGVHLQKIIFSQTDSAWINADIAAILRKTNSLPAGEYHMYVNLAADSQLMQKRFLILNDSSLALQSRARKDLNNIYAAHPRKSFLGISLASAKDVTPISNTSTLISSSSKKVSKAFRSKNLTTVQRQVADKNFIDVFYKEWFIGFYEIDTKHSLTQSIDQERKKLSANISSMTSNNLEDFKSIATQTRELARQKEKKETIGEIGVTGYVSNGQEENSQNENSYYEVRGDVQTTVMDIPVSIEGFYTSQDRHRLAKASYLHLHYDVEEAKAELMKMISGYKGKFEETRSKGQGLEMVYQSYLGKLEGQKSKLLGELSSETGLDKAGTLSLDTAGLKQRLTEKLLSKGQDTLLGSSDSSKLNTSKAKAAKAKEDAEKLYAKANAKYQQIQALEQKIDKYRTLLDQYRNTNYFDSVLAYDKIRDLDYSSETTYKELAKKASNLLPEGKVKSFVTGLTNLDIGIFSKDVSSYTLAGQNMKGLDAGYDLGFCQTAFTIGRVEYVGRDGSIDKYTAYSERLSFKLARNQNLSIIYYGYTPSRAMLREDQFFKDVDLSVPSFKSPVHIVSATYGGNITKYVTVETEAATSFRKHQETTGAGSSLYDRLAYKIQAEGEIPKVNIAMEAGYEHGGKDFENNSLPVSLSGIDRYRIASKGVFFKNFLSLGVEYNYLQQQSFAYAGGNSKWGFEIKTMSKRYPSVSLSYKPFSTFRSYADTLNIPQRPLVGEVWTGKLSYQIKRKDYSVRFTGVFNKNSSQMDTSDYGSNLFQFNCIYLKDKLMAMVILGSATMSGSDLPDAHGNTKFLGVSGGYALNKLWNINAGQDIGVARFGFSKYGANAGFACRMKKAPLTVSANFRYSTYRLTETEGWRQIVGGSLDMLWQFRFKPSRSEKK